MPSKTRPEGLTQEQLALVTGTPGSFARHVSSGRWLMTRHLAYLNRWLVRAAMGLTELYQHRNLPFEVVTRRDRGRKKIPRLQTGRRSQP
jgi:hypothetical protein